MTHCYTACEHIRFSLNRIVLNLFSFPVQWFSSWRVFVFWTRYLCTRIWCVHSLFGYTLRSLLISFNLHTYVCERYPYSSVAVLAHCLAVRTSLSNMLNKWAVDVLTIYIANNINKYYIARTVCVCVLQDDVDDITRGVFQKRFPSIVV